MNCEPNAAELIASDAFWQDPTPVALAADGMHPQTNEDIPIDHLLFATSGSSGVPKWVAISKTALLCSACAVNEHLGVESASVWGLVLPVHHVGGFGLIARARAAGCGFEVFPQSWTPGAFAEWADGHRITHTSLVPTQVHDLVVAGRRAPKGLLACVVGGGRLDTAVGQAARGLGWPVLASYGMTEAGSQIATQSLVALDHPYDPTPIAVLPHWQTRTDCDGCLEIAGPALFSGMVVGGCYQPREGDWHATRDRVWITRGGLVPEGRADALVKIAGELIDPEQVESHIATSMREHGRGIAVVAIPDPRLGSRLVVVAERNVSAHVLASVVDAYNASVPRSQRLGEPAFLDRLPRGPLGKIQRAVLLEML